MTIRRIVVKIGGSTLGQHDTCLEDLVWLQREGIQAVVVHGGGKVVTDWLARLGVPTKFIDGLRATDEASIDVVVAVLAGLVNKQLTAAINALGGRAVGLSGVDGAILRATVKQPALGLVGEVTHVDDEPIEALLAGGFMPVVSSIGVLEIDGEVTSTILNINADTAAGDIGGAVDADTFIFFTDVAGVLGANGEVIPLLSPEDARDMIESGVISGGMIPKVEACLRALDHVTSALIVDGRRPHALRECITGETLGTRIE